MNSEQPTTTNGMGETLQQILKKINRKSELITKQ
jgi:hypothetical protein